VREHGIQRCDIVVLGKTRGKGEKIGTQKTVRGGEKKEDGQWDGRAVTQWGTWPVTLCTVVELSAEDEEGVGGTSGSDVMRYSGSVGLSEI
jgi:hypothetical protein